MATTTPSTGPSTAPVPEEILFDDVKNQTERELQKLKSQLGVIDTDPNHIAEWEKIKATFQEKKDTITKISAIELAELKAEIADPNNTLTGDIDVVDGSLVYNAETASETTTTPETTTTEESIDLIKDMDQGPLRQVHESYQKEVKNHIVNNGGFAGMVMKGISNWITEIIKGIKGFFATFGIEDEGEKKDALAQINGFEDAEEERRVTTSVKALKSSPVTKGPPLSDLLKISHIPNEELTKILKDNPGLDFSSTKNIEAAFTGKYKHSGDREPMRRYDRIFINLADIHDTIDPSEPYNASSKFKEILSGSNKTELDNRIPKKGTVLPATIIAPAGGPTEEENTGPVSPEVQKDLLTQAKDLDTALSKSKIMPEGTPDEKNQKTEAIKNAEENLKKFQEDRKNTIVGEYTDITNRIRDTQTTITMLENRKSPDEKKQLEDAQEELVRLQKIEQDMKTQIDAIMTQNNDRWEINPDISAEKMTTTEIALSAIESNTSTIETQKLTENEEEKLRSEVNSLNTELSGETIVSPNKIASAQKIISEYSENPDLKDSIAKLKSTLDIAKAKIDLVILTIEKKQQMATADRFIKWDNVDDDIYGGWVEIDGSENADGSYLELDADGYFEVDWQLIRGDNPLVKKLGGLRNCRAILIANKSTIKDASNIDALKYNA